MESFHLNSIIFICEKISLRRNCMASAILTCWIDRKNRSKFIQNMHTPHGPSFAKISGEKKKRDKIA